MRALSHCTPLQHNSLLQVTNYILAVRILCHTKKLWLQPPGLCLGELPIKMPLVWLQSISYLTFISIKLKGLPRIFTITILEKVERAIDLCLLYSSPVTTAMGLGYRTAEVTFPWWFKGSVFCQLNLETTKPTFVRRQYFDSFSKHGNSITIDHKFKNWNPSPSKPRNIFKIYFINLLFRSALHPWS